MADQVRFDVSGLADLAEDLRGAGRRYSGQVPAIIKRGAQNIKKDAQQRIRSQSRGRYVRQYPNAITYDITTAHLGTTGGRVTAVVGPDKEKRQGALGNLLEFGSSRNAPLPHLFPAFEAEVPKTEQALQAAAIKSVFRR